MRRLPPARQPPPSLMPASQHLPGGLRPVPASTFGPHPDRPRRPVWGMAFSLDGRLLATASAYGTARLWNPATGEHLRTLTGHTDAVGVWRSARTGGCSPSPAGTTRRGFGD
jgi:WD40 repeat protein